MYEEKYQRYQGFFRYIVEEVVNKYLKCGDLRQGFARVRCVECRAEYLLSFSCRARWFCPSCHQKKVIVFGEFMINNVVCPVPHRQYVFSIPKMLRVYFRYDRKLLTQLCKAAYESLQEYMRLELGKPKGEAGIVMAIQTFGEYLNFHPHLHAVVADGLYTHGGMFYVMPGRDTRPLEELFRAKVIRMLVGEGLRMV